MVYWCAQPDVPSPYFFLLTKTSITTANMEDLKQKYKPEILKTVGHQENSWFYKRKTKPSLWVSSETLKTHKKNRNGKKNR